jgi:hypothetical protein
VKAAAPPNFFATLGFGSEVSRSDCENVADRSARDFGALGSSLEGGGAPADGPCAFARMAAISTFPTGA